MTFKANPTSDLSAPAVVQAPTVPVPDVSSGFSALATGFAAAGRTLGQIAQVRSQFEQQKKENRSKVQASEIFVDVLETSSVELGRMLKRQDPNDITVDFAKFVDDELARRIGQTEGIDDDTILRARLKASAYLERTVPSLAREEASLLSKQRLSAHEVESNGLRGAMHASISMKDLNAAHEATGAWQDFLDTHPGEGIPEAAWKGKAVADFSANVAEMTRNLAGERGIVVAEAYFNEWKDFMVGPGDRESAKAAMDARGVQEEADIIASRDLVAVANGDLPVTEAIENAKTGDPKVDREVAGRYRKARSNAKKAEDFDHFETYTLFLDDLYDQVEASTPTDLLARLSEMDRRLELMGPDEISPQLKRTADEEIERLRQGRAEKINASEEQLLYEIYNTDRPAFEKLNIANNTKLGVKAKQKFIKLKEDVFSGNDVQNTSAEIVQAMSVNLDKKDEKPQFVAAANRVIRGLTAEQQRDTDALTKALTPLLGRTGFGSTAVGKFFGGKGTLGEDLSPLFENLAVPGVLTESQISTLRNDAFNTGLSTGTQRLQGTAVLPAGARVNPSTWFSAINAARAADGQPPFTATDAQIRQQWELWRSDGSVMTFDYSGTPD